MKIFLILALLPIIFFTSCTVQQPLSEESFSKQIFPDTIGTFSNSVESATWEPSSLWSQLVSYHETDTTNWQNAEVRIALLSEKRLRAEYLMDDVILDCVVIKGELTANEFVLKRQHKYDPFIIVVAAYSFSDTRIALNDSQLISESESIGVALLGSVIPFFAAGGFPSTYIYKRN